MIVRLTTTFILFTLLASNASAEDPEQVAVRAYRLTQPLVFDGRLDDDIYRTIEPAPAFRQQEPRIGELATEQTEMGVLRQSERLRVRTHARQRTRSDGCRRNAPRRQPL